MASKITQPKSGTQSSSPDVPAQSDTLTSAAPIKIDSQLQPKDIVRFRTTKDHKELVSWVKEQHTSARNARASKQSQWFVNMSMYYGKQYVDRITNSSIPGISDKLLQPKDMKDKKTINLTRSFVRLETSKFLSSVPTASVIPATSEEQDIRAAYAGEQIWESTQATRKLRAHYSRAVFWQIITGNAFVKTFWDDSICVDQAKGIYGDIRYGMVTPFHLFIPDQREVDIEDQPFVINAYTRPVEWVNRYYGAELNGVNLQPTLASTNNIIDDSQLNISTSGKKPDSVTLYEMWLKPGAHKLFPNGGMVIIVEEMVIGLIIDQMPYSHGQYPFAHLPHLPTGTFYADSPLNDTNELQVEYNRLRTDTAHAGRAMAMPKLLAPKGSIVPGKITNVAGEIIQYLPGLGVPQPLMPPQIPAWYLQQQDRVRQDWEDLTGQHDVSKGDAPAGVTAGTAINYLQEKDDQYLTVQYQSIEDLYEKIGYQTLNLFQQYVDRPRTIKVLGADSGFDGVMYAGSDIKNGTDIRVERGSSIGESKAAKEARINNLVAMGIIPPEMALKLLEMGGAQKVLDTLQVAEKKAQRENIRMKLLDPGMVNDANNMQEEINMQAPAVDPSVVAPDATQQQGITDDPLAEPFLAVPVDNFDDHQTHILVHNTFRMGQEYELLDPLVQEQFKRHVDAHMRYIQQAQLQNFLAQIPEAPDANDVAVAGAAPDPTAPDAGPTMSGNGAVPAPNTEG